MSDYFYFSEAERISAYVKTNRQTQVRKWFIHLLLFYEVPSIPQELGTAGIVITKI